MGLVAKWDQDKIQVKKAASLHSETASQRKIIINLKTNNYVINKKPFCYLFFIN